MSKVRLLVTAIAITLSGVSFATEYQRLPFYEYLHANPELSFQEQETAELLAHTWRAAGFDVTEGIGGYGVVGF